MRFKTLGSCVETKETYTSLTTTYQRKLKILVKKKKKDLLPKKNIAAAWCLHGLYEAA
jgi:hypothetical protein